MLSRKWTEKTPRIVPWSERYKAKGSVHAFSQLDVDNPTPLCTPGVKLEGMRWTDRPLDCGRCIKALQRKQNS